MGFAMQRMNLEEPERRYSTANMEALGLFAGGIAHDFNNILGAILGYGELAEDNIAESEAAHRYLDQILRAAARGRALVDQILSFSRSGVAERTLLQMNSVVNETLDLLAGSLPPNVHLRRTFDASKPAVVGDATQLHQVIMNLCTNALHAMGQSGVLTVGIGRAAIGERRELSHGTLSAGEYVQLSVGDTGVGIPPAVIARMFDPFFTTKPAGCGTGLGLAVVYGIVADLGGAIDVTTEPGVGTNFVIWLPAAEEPQALKSRTGRDVAEDGMIAPSNPLNGGVIARFLPQTGDFETLNS